MSRRPAPLATLPYNAATIAAVLKRMPPGRLHEVGPSAFQTWPAKIVMSRAVVAELIATEIAGRGDRS